MPVTLKQPEWVTRVLPEVDALKTEYQTRYDNEWAALSKKEQREGGKPSTNPNIWTHLSGVGRDLRAGKYDDAVETLGTMVGMGRGIGSWVGGEAYSKIRALITGVRADTPNKHPGFPSDEEIAAGRASIRKVRFLRLDGMKASEALRNEGSCFADTARFDLVTSEMDDPAKRKWQRDQYTIVLRDGELLARQWNVVDGFHDRKVIYAGDDPFNRRPVSDLSEAQEMKSVPAPTETIILPLEKFEEASSACYALMKLTEQRVKDGVAQPVAVPAIKMNGMLVTGMGGSYRGLDSEFDAWELTPETTYQGPTSPRYHDEEAIKAGLRRRGDHTGLLVTHRGRRLVLARKITVKASAPSLQYAVNLVDAKKHDSESSQGPWRATYGDPVRWVEKAGFVLSVFAKSNKEELTMLYYRNKHGAIDTAYVKDLDSFTGPIPSADVWESPKPNSKADKRESKAAAALAEDRVMMKLIEALRALS